MLNLYAVLGVAMDASEDDIAAAIAHATHTHRLPKEVLQDAQTQLRPPKARAAYDAALKSAMQQGLAHTDWQRQWPIVAPPVPLRPAPTLLLPPVDAVTHHQANARCVPTEEHAKMKKRHWLVLVLCSLVTVILVAVLWQMVQVQRFQNEQIVALQKMTAERRLPEDWPTWEQLNGETFLHAKGQPGAKLMIYKNATQDLPVMLLPSKQRIDCRRRGNQYCDVTLVFNGQNPHTFEAQIIGSSLIFNDHQQLPLLMHQLSEAASIQAIFPKADTLPSLIFERQSKAESKPKTKTP